MLVIRVHVWEFYIEKYISLYAGKLSKYQRVIISRKSKNGTLIQASVGCDA
jgi:hypothetical protein